MGEVGRFSQEGGLSMTTRVDLPVAASGIPEPPICPDQRSSVVVIGGGVAGVWAAYQLIKAGIDTTMITYQAEDRGGIQGASRRSAGAFNTSALTAGDLDSYLQKIGHGQTHPSVAPALAEHLPKALAEVASLVNLKPIKIGLALASGTGEEFLELMYRNFRALGGKIINGWVTRLVTDGRICRGVQYDSPLGIGKLRCRAIVIASGGYAGLFANSIRTNCFGSVLGYYLASGGIATNLEFLFKHGYGNIDANALTPTEELPGAEIYDTREERVSWLEELLFNRQGTSTHLQAVQLWLRDPNSQYYVDLSYRTLYLKLWGLNSKLANAGTAGDDFQSAGGDVIGEVVEMFPGEARSLAKEKISRWIEGRQSIDYRMFEELKPLFKPRETSRFRVRPLTYFSMGGIGHVDFATNLKGVYVTGEAMHDFGANRVGGLPWSLYLASAYAITDAITHQLGREGSESWAEADDFELVAKRSSFDSALLSEIQQRLYESQERQLTAARAGPCIEWLRRKRKELIERQDVLHDGISWLLVAEAIMQCSVCRTESRGFFFRFDFQNQNESLESLHSCAWYDEITDRVLAQLLPWPEIELGLRNGFNGKEREAAYGGIGQRC
jgi:4-hydroxybenzoate adenylyltransferase